MLLQAVAIAHKVGEVCGRLVYAIDACNPKQFLPHCPVVSWLETAPITQAAQLPCVLLTCCSKPPSDFSLQAERYCLSLVALCRKLGSILGDTGTLSTAMFYWPLRQYYIWCNQSVAVLCRIQRLYR